MTAYSQESLARSSYEGWVAWVGGRPVTTPDGTQLGYDAATPLFEYVPSAGALRSTVEGVQEREVRPRGRLTMDWRDVPQDQIVMLELYAFRDVYDFGGPFDVGQPIIQIQKSIGHTVRWIQYKRGAMILRAAAGPDAEPVEGTVRSGVQSWVIGFWDQTVGLAKTWEVSRTGKTPPSVECRVHPCWPRNLGGMGLAPNVLGLTPQQVPDWTPLMTGVN